MDLYNSIPLVHRVFQIFGVSQVTIDRKNDRMYPRKAWKAHQILTSICIGYMGFVELISYTITAQSSLAYSILLASQLSSNYLTQFSICFERLRVHFERHSLIFRKLGQLDRKQNRLAPLSKDAFQAIRRRIVVYSACYAVMISSSFVYGVLHAHVIFPWTTLLHALMFNLSFLVLGVKCYQIALLIYLMKVHMDRLNQSLRAMCNPLRCRKAILCENFAKLKLAQAIYDDIYELTQMICATFGFFILINIIFDMFNITANIYWLILLIKLSAGWRILGMTLLILPHVWRFTTLALMSQLAVNSGSKAGSYINKVLVDFSQTEHANLVEMFLLQVLHKPIEFPIYNLVHLNATIFLSFFGILTTYLVFLLQMTNDL